MASATGGVESQAAQEASSLALLPAAESLPVLSQAGDRRPSRLREDTSAPRAARGSEVPGLGPLAEAGEEPEAQG